MRILSGIQPSGTLHLGNYFGMMRPAIELQEKGEAFYFIANYHSMTSLFDPDQRRKNSLRRGAGFPRVRPGPEADRLFPPVRRAGGDRADVAALHRHADGPARTRHSYKDKIAKGIAPSHGLFAYPVLMAADILIYDSNVVPVGATRSSTSR
jgi:tryptophanyl-tRNA synthetase